MYYTYILRCIDDSLYTGITTDIKRRMEEHFSKGDKCAKYTLSHTAKKLECVWQSENKALASKLEFYIKRLPRVKKEELIKKNNLEELLGNKLETNKYKILNNFN